MRDYIQSGLTKAAQIDGRKCDLHKISCQRRLKVQMSSVEELRSSSEGSKGGPVKGFKVEGPRARIIFRKVGERLSRCEQPSILWPVIHIAMSRCDVLPAISSCYGGWQHVTCYPRGKRPRMI